MSGHHEHTELSQSMLEIMQNCIQHLNIEDCREVVNMLATRAAHLEGVAFGLEDVSAAMADAIAENEAEVCNCGKCDECKAAYSDRMHDRKRDSE